MTNSRRIYPHDIDNCREIKDYLEVRRELGARSFTQDDIAYSVRLPHSEVSRALNKVLIPLGDVKLDHTVGARKFYALVR